MIRNPAGRAFFKAMPSKPIEFAGPDVALAYVQDVGSADPDLERHVE